MDFHGDGTMNHTDRPPAEQRFRASYLSDPTLGDRVFGLLERTFPGVLAARRNAERFGAPWEQASTPFVVQADIAVLAHVGLLDLPLHLMGQPISVGGVHGVATDPAFQRRGLFRGLLEELLTFAQAKYSTLVLTTLHPEYFQPFGFRIVPETVGVSDGRMADLPRGRRLDLTQPDDLRLLHSLIERRTPVSRLLGVGAEKACFGFVEFATPMWYSDVAGYAVVAERVAETLRVYDLVGPTVPNPGEVVALVGEPVDRVLWFLPTDRIDPRMTRVAHDLNGGPDTLEPGSTNWVLMVRGPFEAESQPIMLPRPARC